PREPPTSSTSQSVCGATSAKRNLPVVAATARARTAAGSPCSRSAASSASSRARTARTLSSSIGDLQEPEAHLVGRSFAPEDVALRAAVVETAADADRVACRRVDRPLEVVRVLPVEVPARDVQQRLRAGGAGIQLEPDVDAAEM